MVPARVVHTKSWDPTFCVFEKSPRRFCVELFCWQHCDGAIEVCLNVKKATHNKRRRFWGLGGIVINLRTENFKHNRPSSRWIWRLKTKCWALITTASSMALEVPPLFAMRDPASVGICPFDRDRPHTRRQPRATNATVHTNQTVPSLQKSLAASRHNLPCRKNASFDPRLTLSSGTSSVATTFSP